MKAWECCWVQRQRQMFCRRLSFSLNCTSSTLNKQKSHCQISGFSSFPKRRRLKMKFSPILYTYISTQGQMRSPKNWSSFSPKRRLKTCLLYRKYSKLLSLNPKAKISWSSNLKRLLTCGTSSSHTSETRQTSIKKELSWPYLESPSPRISS